MSTPDRIDIIAAAALQGLLAGHPWPTQRTMDEAVRLSLELGHRYHALRQPDPMPVADPPSPPPVRTDTNVHPLFDPNQCTDVPVMGKIS